MSVKYFTHLIILDLINVRMLDEEYKL